MTQMNADQILKNHLLNFTKCLINPKTICENLRHLRLKKTKSKRFLKKMNSNAQRDPETYAIIGAAMEVHRELGNGFLERVYHDALELEFTQRGIPYRREYSIPVCYKGEALGTPYRSDFLCFDTIIVELKAIKALTDIESAQVLHYLKATKLTRALLINFATPRLDYKRFINSKHHPH